MLPDDMLLAGIQAARKRIKEVVLQTPLLCCDWLSTETSVNVFLKLESEQKTGSFKFRGASNKITKLCEEDEQRCRRDGFVTASSGNHAVSCAQISKDFGLKLSIYTYVSVAATKEEKISAFENVKLIKYGQDCCEAEVAARDHANQNSLIYVSPYNDIDVISGQASIGLELLEQCQGLDAVLVPVGGGGLISGIAAAIKLLKPSITVIGCQPKADCCMYECVKAGRIVEDNVMLPTFADGTAGRVEPGSITFDFCRRFVDEWILVEEEDIEQAVFDMLVKGKKLIEGAAGIVVAALRSLDKRYKGKNVALIICGANIGVEEVWYLLQKYLK